MSGAARILEPEILDFLGPDDPRALRSRRDLVRINLVMRQQAIMANLLRSSGPAPRAIADLGSGDGRFLLGVARQMARIWPGVTAIIVDRQDIVAAETKDAFAALGWRCECETGDVFEILPRLDAGTVTANLFLHHLDDAALSGLLRLASEKTRTFVACEPRRSPAALLASRMVFALGCNDVTRHDAVASVRAGFSGHEISRLWPPASPEGWNLREGWAFPFSHYFMVRRNES